jgi:RimJ/RimL family protein N-acetyltransferase
VELRDADLVLRPPRPDDVDAIVAACNDDEIARFIPLMPSPYERSDAERWLRRCKQVWAHGSAYPFVIAVATADRLLGAIELRPGDGSVGYWVDASARGRGVATRALRLVCEWHAERPLHLVTHPDNAGSQRVAEKAGFHRAGLQPHEPHFRDGTAEAIRFELD